MRPRDALRHPLVVVAAVLLVVLGAATATPWTVDVPRWVFGMNLGRFPAPTPPPEEPLPPPPPPAPEPSDNSTLVTVLLVLAALVVAALAWYVARKIVAAVRATPKHHITPDDIGTGDGLATPDAPAVPLPELADAVTRALAHLDDARTPNDGVVAAWVALEDTVAEHGTHRDPAQTSTEFTRTVLDTTPAPPTHLDTLRRLYQRARFTDHPITDDDVTRARTALVAIARTLADHPTPEQQTAP